MGNEKLISSFYKILLLFEDVHDSGSNITEGDYLAYLERQYLRFLGSGVSEAYDLIKGLQIMGADAEHRIVKSTVFHLIDMVKKGAFDNAS